jgi:excisionase family DNA binding protein
MNAHSTDTRQPINVPLNEAARLLGLSQKKVWSLAKDGAVPSIKCGSRRLFNVQSLEQWSAAQLPGVK